MIRQLRRKFIASAMLAIFLVLAIIMCVINGLNYRNVVSQADNLIAILADNDGYFPKEKNFELGSDYGREIGPDFRGMTAETPYETRFFFVIFNSSDVATAIDTGHIAAITSDEAETLGETVLNSGKTGGFLKDYRYRCISTAEGGTMVIFIDCQKSMSSFRTFFLTSIFVSLAGLISVFVLVVLFSRMVFRPVAESDRKQKQFITDAGHEIKTPLTIIDANVEVIEMDYGESEWTHSIHNQVARLTALTRDLISLARMDESGQKLQKAEFDLSHAVSETVEGFAAVAMTQGKKLEQNCPEGLMYTGDEKSIRQLVGILLDNAVKYSDENGTIRISLEKKGKNCCLSVYNTAEHVDRSDLSHLFERFYRSDQSRNSSTGGYGIGLSIAQAIVLAHKGKIAVKTEDEKSIEFTVLL